MNRHHPPTHHLHPSTGTVRRLAAAGAVAALGLSLAACGGDDDVADLIDTTDTTMADDMATDTTMADDMATDTTMADDMATDTTMADDMATETTIDSTVEDVLTDTLAGEGVDLFLTLLPLVGLDNITDADQVTILAPSDEAFQSISAAELAAIVEDPALIREVLEAHLVESEVLSSDLNDGDTITPISGEDLTVTIDGDTVMIGRATIVGPDIMFDGGVIHVIDDVLALPER